MTALGKTAEHCAQFLVVGQEVTVQGHLSKDIIEIYKKNDETHYGYEIRAHIIEFCQKPKATKELSDGAK